MSFPTIAKAWRYPPTAPSSWDGFRSLELKDVQVPKPGKGQVLDLKVSFGRYIGGPYNIGTDNGGLIPLSDGAGQVVAIGEGVTEWSIGDRVHSLFSESWVNGPIKEEYWATMIGAHAQGCLTQYRIFSADFLLAVPDHLSYEEAATVTCAGVTAFNALFESGLTTPDSTVLVLGSGGVSVYGAQLAKAAGATVIATTSSDEKAKKYKALGVDHVINYWETPNWADEVKKLTGGEGVDQVFEIGGKGTLMEAAKAIKTKGVVHLISVPQDDAPTASIYELAMSFLLKEGKASTYSLMLNGVAIGGKDVAQRLDDFITKHQIKPILDPKVFGWGEAKEAFEYLDRGAHFGKVVIRVE